MGWLRDRRETPIEQIESDAAQLYERTLTPIAARFGFERPPAATETSRPPLVLVLGNHSSGKSSFINYLLGEDFQRTGVAPIDDGFTIITHGDRADDREGDAIVGNPDLPWAGLKAYGTQLVTHLRLRHCAKEKLQGVTIVDSPGMMDSPDGTDRGYDFRAVVRWFAQRADVILLIFDGDKPGTTGETLKTLTASLRGAEDRLLLVFNKADRFVESRDYARAYGALCWNLAKVLDTQDLPHIYTTYLPVPSAIPERSALPKEDFDRQRDEISERILSAPSRRADNIISHLYRYARRLRMHARVLDQIARERRNYLLLRVTGAILTLGVGYALWQLISLEIAIGSLIGLLGVIISHHFWSKRQENSTPLDTFFERAYRDELARADDVDDIRSQWQSLRPAVERVYRSGHRVPTLSGVAARRLSRIIDDTVPRLRKQSRKA